MAFVVNRIDEIWGTWTGVQTCSSKYLGVIYAKEFHNWDSGGNICGNSLDPVRLVYFLSSQYGFVEGVIPANHPYYPKSVLNYSLGTVTLNGKTYKVFEIQNRVEEVWHPNGNLVVYLPTGSQIATDVYTTGATKKYAWLIRAYRAPGGSWCTRFDDGRGNVASYGFVDTGLRSGSGPRTISIKTSLV